MHFLVSLLASAALTAPGAPPPATAAFLAAVASGDLGAARARLSDSVVILDERSGSPVASSLEAFADSVRGCERTGLTWEIDQNDPARAAATATWSCAARPSADAFIWTDLTGVVHVQFGMRPLR
ncbi:MAG: hypothetical protein ACXWUX_08330 [Allosphingosinicella sp.]